MSPSFWNALRSPASRWTPHGARAQTLLPLALIAVGLPLAAWAHAVPSQRVLTREVRACQHRLVVGYTTSGIEISADDARTIREACERAVHERWQGQGALR